MNFFKKVTDFIDRMQPDVGFLMHVKVVGDDAGKIIGAYKAGDNIPHTDNSVCSISVTNYVFKKNDLILKDLIGKTINWEDVPDHRKKKWRDFGDELEWNMIKGYVV